jgi:chromosome segregation ATPase
MDKLDLILRKLEVLEEEQKELNQISRVIRDRQEETDANL